MLKGKFVFDGVIVIKIKDIIKEECYEESLRVVYSLGCYDIFVEFLKDCIVLLILCKLLENIFGFWKFIIIILDDFLRLFDGFGVL